MTSVARQNTFKNVLNLYNYDVGPTYLGDETVRGLRNLRGECLPILNRYGKIICRYSLAFSDVIFVAISRVSLS